ncbi:hypothetical protein GCM10023340_40180 [Nocardioides marinquilinus]|uniref:Uncharacterized protein n=1 Tax=Nocardioides marinquilinus TaxID=1210400 RepID=A0ABP9Q3D2_9ACTN
MARDVARLGPRFHAEGLRFTKYEALRRAYDQVLAEACDVLEVDHLLTVLPPGPDRDLERERVERLLRGTGMVAPA